MAVFAGTSHPSALFVLLSCALALAAAQVNPCPAPESLRPCTCDRTGINCLKAKSTAELAKAFSGKEKTIHRALWIQRRPIVRINNDTFGDYAFGQLYVEMNSNLTSFPLSSLDKSSKYLTELSLYGNRFNTLTSIDYRWLPRFQRLRVLNLAKNNLRYVPVGGFSNPSLETLSLNNNPIEKIDAFAFKNLPRLKSLQLRFIRAKVLDAYSFSIPKHHPELEINLMGGNLQTIEENAFTGTAPLSLDLKFNALKEFSAPVFQPLITAMASNARKHQMLGDARISTKGNSFTCSGCEFSWMTALKSQPEVMLMLIDFRCRDQTPVWNITKHLIGCSYNPRP
ncbi:uncharacterized protein LOC144106521 isoform X1 [Amblyomma americanum]